MIGFNFNAAVGRIATFQKRFGQRVFDFRLNCAFERAGAIHGVEAGFGDDVQRGIVHMQMQVLGGQAFFETAQLDFGDAADIGLIQAVEHHHFVDTVDQLGAEMRFHVFHHHFFERFVIVGAHLLDVLAADIGSHHNHGVFKVYRAALAVGEAAVVEHLQQNVKHIGVGFFHFVEQNHAVRLAAHLLGEIAALFIAHIARRRADQAGNAVFFHVFRHIDAD